MEYTIKKDEKYILVGLKADKLDAVISPDLKSDFVKYNQDGYKNMILDLTETKYIDSSGLSAILVANRLCKNDKGTFVLTGVSDHVNKLITISQLHNVLEIRNTTQEAVDLIFMNELENDLNNN
jgi:anti-sigma B factor antagonist